MAVTYTTAVKNARMTAVKDAIDAGSAQTAGRLEIGTSSMAATIVTFPLRVPGSGGAGTVASGVLSLMFDSGTGSATKQASLAGTNTAAAARIRDRDLTDIVTGLTVGVGTGDIQLDSTSITQNQNVTINAATITHAA